MSMIFMALAGVLIVAPPAKAISLNTSFFSDDYYETANIQRNQMNDFMTQMQTMVLEAMKEESKRNSD
jgi:hypothetical protein